MELRDAIMAARTPEDVFGDDPAYVARRYRELAREFHPDHGGGDAEAFVALTRLYETARKALAAGRYGDRATIGDPVVIATRRHAYSVTDLVARGEVAAVYAASYEAEDGSAARALLKVVRSPGDGPQLAAEAKVLRALLSSTGAMFDLISPYLPGYIEDFGYRRGRTMRKAIAFTYPTPMVTLAEVRRAFPAGLDPRDAAWMIRRLLYVLGLAHAIGYAHTKVNLSHTLIAPEDHGLVLVDWRQAVAGPDRVTMGEDLRAAVATAMIVTSPRLPRGLRRFYEGVMMIAPHRLPDGLALLDEYDELIEDLWGPRRFRPFVMPAAVV